MAIVMQMHWRGVTPEQYDDARRVVGWEARPASGGSLHVAWFDDGLRVWDVWDTADAFDAFVQQRLMPGVAKVGIQGEPDVAIKPAHYFQVEVTAAASGALAGGPFPSAEAYDALAAKVDWAGEPPAGGLCHIAARNDDGSIDTIAVWASEADNERFSNGRIADAAAALGLAPDALPTVERYHPIHAIWAPPR